MNPSILIFDSGVGGLSILKEIRQRVPGADLHYLMDNAFFPYGVKPDDLLIERILSVCLKAASVLNPDLLVVACNTASTLALHQLRTHLSIPVVGVVPAIKVAASQTSSGHIGLLATAATVNRSYTDKLVEDFASHCEVHRFGSSELVQWAEDYLQNGLLPEALYDHLQGWIAANPAMSHIVLGCTHFPLLRNEFERLWPQIGWIDSGSAIARRVESLLSGRGLEGLPAPLSCYWTGEEDTAQGAVNFLRQFGQLQTCAPLRPEKPVQETGSV